MDRIAVIRHSAARSFLLRAGAWLEHSEAENCLILGLATTLVRHPERFLHPPLLATLEQREEIVGAALMTPPRRLIITRTSQSALAALADDLYAQGVTLPGVHAPDPGASIFAQRWAEHSGQSTRLLRSLRVYTCDEVKEPKYAPGKLRAANSGDESLLVEWCRAFCVEVGMPEEACHASEGVLLRIAEEELYVWEERGNVVSMAAWGSPTSKSVRIFLVYTPPQERGRGLATSCSAALTRHLLEDGRRCFLYADLANPTANRIYRRIGYQPAADYQDWAFGE